MDDPEILSDDQFLTRYISFNKKLAKQEVELPENHRLVGKERLELFQFYFVDKRNQQDMKRVVDDRRKQEEEDEEEENDFF